MATKGNDFLKKYSDAENETPTTSEKQSTSDGIGGGESSITSIAGISSSPRRQPEQSTSEDPDDQIKLGQELATIFKDSGIHPVFIFGSKGSGKTSLLASLFRYIQVSERSDATLSFREDIFPSGDDRWNRHTTWARDVFYRKVHDAINSKAPQATIEASPFFVPVKLTRSTGEEISFAFLEGMGEWYMPDENAEVPFKPFKGFLQGLLQQFNGSATVIYVAPFTTAGYSANDTAESSKSADLRKSDLGLLGAINEYINLRRAQFHQDNHLFLMSKWDIFCGGVSSDSFFNPSGDDIQDAFKDRFIMAWTRFQNLNSSNVKQNKIFSAYCAGVISDLSILKPSQEDSEVIDRYPRKLWDWLHLSHSGIPLYQDMQPRRPNLLDRFIRLLRG